MEYFGLSISVSYLPSMKYFGLPISVSCPVYGKDNGEECRPFNGEESVRIALKGTCLSFVDLE